MGKSGRDYAFCCSDRFPFIVLCDMNASGLPMYNVVSFFLEPTLCFSAVVHLVCTLCTCVRLLNARGESFTTLTHVMEVN